MSGNGDHAPARERALRRAMRLTPAAYLATAAAAAQFPASFGVPWWLFAAIGVALAAFVWRATPSIIHWLAVIAAGQAVMGVVSVWDGTPAHPDVSVSVVIMVAAGVVGAALVARVDKRIVWAYAAGVSVWSGWISLLEGLALGAVLMRAGIVAVVLAFAPLITAITKQRLHTIEVAQSLRLQLQATVAEAVRTVVLHGSDGLAHALERIAKGIGADVVTAERYEERDGKFHVAELWAHGSCPTVRLDAGWYVSDEHAMALASGRPARIETPIHGAVLPITSDRGLLGGLRLACNFHHHVAPEDLEMIGSFAEIVGAMWAREEAVHQAARSRDNLRAHVGRQNALADTARSLLMTKGDQALLSTLGTLLDATDAAVASIWAPSEDGNGLRVIRASVGASYELDVEEMEAPLEVLAPVIERLRSGDTVAISADADGAPHEQMFSAQGLAGGQFVPIVVRDEWHGALSICRTPGSEQFSAEDMDFLDRVGILVSAYYDEQATRDQLRELLRSKDRFIASVSHELRTPLAAVVGLSAELAGRDNDFDSTERVELASMVSSQAAEVSYIVEDLLVAARAESDMLTIVAEPVNLGAEVEGVLEIYESSAAIEVHAAEARAIADSHRTRQIIRNLLVNADRYGGDRVRVETGLDAEMAFVAVCDNGPGIAPDRVEAVFDPYERAHDAAGTPDSVGLGLAVARQLARLMGGDVVYERDDWTTFKLLVPIDSNSSVGGAAGSSGTQGVQSECQDEPTLRRLGLSA